MVLPIPEKLENSTSGSIGVFDSGVGGLSVLLEIRNLLITESLIYVADQAHVPYGIRSINEVKKFSKGIVKFLLDQGSKLIVVACNTASAAALQYLRQTFPTVPFVGMEPAVKPAAELSISKKVGVLATPATFQGKLYTSLVARFAKDVELFQHTCPGLVNQIEKGEFSSKKTRLILETALTPMLDEGIDTVVLGCTHYPFVMPMISKIVGKGVRVIDPAPAIAKRVEFVLKDQFPGNSIGKDKSIRFYTSGDAKNFQKNLPLFFSQMGKITQLEWKDHDRLLHISA